MASSYKTPYLNLNRFVGTDKPKMDDFNSDNNKIDSAIKNHAEDTDAHVSIEEKERWNGGAFIMGTYNGDGTDKREIPIGFKPRLCMVYQSGMPLVSFDSQSGTNIRSGIACLHGCTQFISLTQNGFVVENMDAPAPFGATPKLNAINNSYVYIAYK